MNREASSSRKVRVGTIVVSVLGTVFSSPLIIAGSFLNWRSDIVLGLFGQSGWRFSNLVSGDGKISFVIGVISFFSFLLGAALTRKSFYGIALVCSLAILALSVYEIVFLYTRSGIISPGGGLFMLLGGAVSGILLSCGGYSMVGEGKRSSNFDLKQIGERIAR